MKYPNQITNLKNKKPITMLTAYDYSMASILNKTNIDIILVGDSLANVIQGEIDTVPVTVEHMIYHSKAVRKGAPDKFVVSDLPFMGNMYSIDKSVETCVKIFQEAKVNAIKIEGGAYNSDLITKLTKGGIPIMGHLGLTPQTYMQLGGYKKQGKDIETKEKILEDAKILEQSGIFSLVLECLEEDLAKDITKSLKIPTIGIGSGSYTDGQVLVINDLLNLTNSKTPSFVKPFIDLNRIIIETVNTFISSNNK